MLPTTTGGSWGADTASTKDLLIPRIQLAQATSELCKEGSARPGELLHSATKECLAAKGEKIEFLPITVTGHWATYRIDGKKRHFVGRELITPKTDGDQWTIEDFSEKGEPIVKLKELSFLVLLTSRINRFPFFIDFSKSNRNGGKHLSTIMQENKFQGRPAPATVVALSTIIRTHESNSWFIFAVTPTRDATPEELVVCKKWFDIFSTSGMKVVEEEPDNGIS